ncbi:MAG TPA: GDP-mannose 4,6-dehydratase, partial [Blastocatellia bacterium]|nr:GDP-mannose 4,6-dehydratase [Blastocatellia bacterium]
MDTMLITGGAGFIGSNFARHVLARSDARLVIIDKLTYAGNLANIEEVLRDLRVRFVNADIADKEAMTSIFNEHRPTSVVNFAAESHVDRSIDDPSSFIETNIVGAFTLLEASRRYLAQSNESARRAFRFLHVSTDEVYGALGETGLFSEAAPYAPNSPYAASKASADHLVRAWHETYQLPAILTNCSNNYGPYQFPEKLIPLMLLNAIDGKPLP